MANSQDLIGALRKIGTQIGAESDRFRALDARVGDGDLGVTVTAIAEAIGRTCASSCDRSPGEILTALSHELANANPSTFSGFVRIGIRAAAAAINDDPALFEEGHWAELLTSAIEGIQARKGASLGAKTVLDALDGSREALPRGHAGHPAELAELGARTRMAELQDRAAAAGRASFLADRTIGERDPGAEVWICAMQALAVDSRQVTRP